MSQKEFRLKGEKVEAAPARFSLRKPLESSNGGGSGIPDWLRRRARGAAFSIAVRLSSPRRIPGEGSDSEEGIEPICQEDEGRTDGPESNPMYIDESRSTNLSVAKALMAGEGVSTPAGLNVRFLGVESRDGKRMARVEITSPHLKEAVCRDVEEGGCVLVPGLDETTIIVTDIDCGLLMALGTASITVIE